MNSTTNNTPFFLGFDIGSSSVKVAAAHADTGATIGIRQSPAVEMEISAPEPGWAEQHPDMWWEHACNATRALLQEHGLDGSFAMGIGISYQMHGLVLVGDDLQPLRPAIIWCDSRAVDIGNKAFREIGEEACMEHLLNSPGNFTASKLKWVMTNEPEVYDKARYLMLPGDYIALRMTGVATTSIGGLSEGILWDFRDENTADIILDHYGIDPSLVPPVLDNCVVSGELTQEAADALGLTPGIPVAYRAGDQPNNALSLGVLQPGQVAATAGTSGVIYGVLDAPVADRQGRINSFAHVNYKVGDPVIGALLCINGSGILYGWLRRHMSKEGDFGIMGEKASGVRAGAEGLSVLPFGNGAERMLRNRDIGAHFLGVNFNRHTEAHFYRAALEGVAYAFAYGADILKELGITIESMRVGNDNMFQAPVFAQTLASLVGAGIQVVDTTGAVGAAKAAGCGTGYYRDLEEAVGSSQVVKTYTPDGAREIYMDGFLEWRSHLDRLLDAGR